MRILTCLILVFSFVAQSNAQKVWRETQTLRTKNPRYEDRFGNSLLVDGNRAFVGVENYDYDENGENTEINCGAVYYYEKSSTGNWILQQVITVSNRRASIYLGSALAVEGNTLYVGAEQDRYYYTASDYVFAGGSVYVFELQSNGRWLETDHLQASDVEEQGRFGSSLSVENGTLVVGSNGHDKGFNVINPPAQVGAVYVFEKSGGAWVEKQKLTSSKRSETGYFGEDVVIKDGVIYIGSMRDEYNEFGASHQSNGHGAVYIFKKDGTGTWNQDEKIIPPVRSQMDFGARIDVEGDYLIVGAEVDSKDLDDGTTSLPGSNDYWSGSVFIYKKNGNSWDYWQKLKANRWYVQSQFGTDVDLNGNYLAVANPGDNYDENDSLSTGRKGSVYIYEKTAADTFKFYQKFVPKGDFDWSFFQCSFDGNHLFSSCAVDYDDNTHPNEENIEDRMGRVYVFDIEDPTEQLSVESFGALAPLNLFPNPMQSQLNNPEGLLLNIYDVHGNMVLSSSAKQINVEFLSSGVYLVVADDLKAQVLVKE